MLFNSKDALGLLAGKLTRSTAKTTARNNICVELQIARRIAGLEDANLFGFAALGEPSANWTNRGATGIVGGKDFA